MFPLPAENRVEFNALRGPGLRFSLGFAAFLLALFADPLLLPKTFASRDMAPFFLPIEKAVHESWRHGAVPLLLPEVSFGRPLAANPNTGAFYPLRIAMAALPFRFAFKLFPVIHLWIAGVGAFLLAGSFGLSPAACALAGSVFALCGPAVSEVLYPNILPGLALFPWIVWAGGRIARRRTLRNMAIFGAIWGADLLVGDVFTAGLALFGAGLLVAQESEARERPSRLGALLLASGAGLLIAGVQIVPALLFVPHTVRALGRFPVRAAMTWSVSPWRLLEMLVPFPFGNAASSPRVWGDSLWSNKTAGFFQTLFPGVFAASALLFVRPPRGRRLFVYGIVFLSVAASAIGVFLPESWLSAPSPIPLRYPEKLMVGAALGIALLAGIAFDSLRRGTHAPAAIGVLAVAVLLGAASFAARGMPLEVASFIDRHWSLTLRNGSEGARQLPRMLLESAGLWAALGLIVVWASFRRGAALVAVFLFSIADLSALRWRTVATESDATFFSPPPAARALARLQGTGRFGFLPLEDYYLGPGDRGRSGVQRAQDALKSDLGAAFGVFYSMNQDYDVSDFYRVELVRREIYRDSGRWPGLQDFLGAFSARAAIVERGRIPNGFPVFSGTVLGPEWLVLNPSALPGFRLAKKVVEVADVGEAYSRIHAGRIDLRSATIVETGRSAETDLSGGILTIRRNDPERIVARTDTPGPSRLVFPRAPFPFRTATVDGGVVPVDPANLCLSSIAVPAGSHEISIREQLPGGAAGPAISIAGAAVLLFCWRESRES